MDLIHLTGIRRYGKVRLQGLGKRAGGWQGSDAHLGITGRMPGI
jgi:hypothetical protein